MSASHLCDYLEASTIRFLERVAAVDTDGTTLTYRELNEAEAVLLGPWLNTACSLVRGTGGPEKYCRTDGCLLCHEGAGCLRRW